MAAGLEFSPYLFIDKEGAVLRNMDQNLADDIFSICPLEVYRIFMRPHAVFHVCCKTQVKGQLHSFPDPFVEHDFPIIVNHAKAFFLRMCFQHLQCNSDKREWSGVLPALLEIDRIIWPNGACAKIVIHLQVKLLGGVKPHLLLEGSNKHKGEQKGHGMRYR